MMEINFDELFKAGANTLEIYLCPPGQGGENEDVIGSGPNDVYVGWNGRPMMRTGNTLTLEEFYYKDMVCSYDKATDSQRISRRILIKDFHVGNLYLALFKEEQVPAFMFPCTTDISHKCVIQRKMARINNRLFIVNDKEGDTIYIYTRYTHSDNVDATKAKADINTAITRMMSSV